MDTGATNYILGSRMIFTKLDTTVLGTMRFNGDLVTQIEGGGKLCSCARMASTGPSQGCITYPD